MEAQGSLSDGAMLLRARGLLERTISGWVRQAQDFNLREFHCIRISSVREGCARLLGTSNKSRRLRKQENDGEFLLEATDGKCLSILKLANERSYLKHPLKDVIKIQTEEILSGKQIVNSQYDSMILVPA